MAQCWICEENEAEDVTRGGYDGKQLRCRSCGRYDVVGAVVLKLGMLSLSQKAAALTRAKRHLEVGQVATISRLSF